MTTPPGRRAESRLGRKQDEDLDEAILAATRELLLERGYDSFNTRDVAQRAETGSGAIYRRWSSKEYLVAEAIRTGGELSYERSADAAVDFVNLIQARATLATTHPDFTPGVVSAMRANEQINEAMQQVHTTNAYREVLERILGPDHPQMDLLAELAPAIIVHRTIFQGHELEPEQLGKDVLALVQALAGQTAL